METPDSAARDKTVGQGDYVVASGDCLSSIAEATGFFWQTLWDLPENAELKRVRNNPNALMPGDRLTIPVLRVAEVPCVTGRRHDFRRRGVPTYLRLRFLLGPDPRAGEPFEIEIQGQTVRGTLDHDGRLKLPVPHDVTSGTVVVGKGVMRTSYPFRLGTLAPATSSAGALQRLCNLGYDCGGETSADSARARGAVASFQRKLGLDPSGTLDDGTCAALAKDHGS